MADRVERGTACNVCVSVSAILTSAVVEADLDALRELDTWHLSEKHPHEALMAHRFARLCRLSQQQEVSAEPSIFDTVFRFLMMLAAQVCSSLISSPDIGRILNLNSRHTSQAALLVAVRLSLHAAAILAMLS